MFRQFLQRTTASPLLAHAFADTEAMLRTNAAMFDEVAHAFLTGEQPRRNIEIMDEDVNVAERTVRRGVFQHLTLNPRTDLTASLVLLSVVHDAERVGDYIKALLRVLALLGFPTPAAAYRERFVDLIESTRPLFEATRIAFIDGEPEQARTIVARHTGNREKAWGILAGVIDDQDLDRRQTILLTIGGRQFKRISGHLGNIASSVVQPFDKIGAKDEDA